MQTDPADHVGAGIEAAGHAVQVVFTPLDAMPIARDGGIDCIVIDAYDPRVRITELARQIDALPDAPPIVLVSSSPHAPEISARIGATAFLLKPCDPGELNEIIDRIVRGNRPVRRVEG
ncbi:MAG: hypothetical protein NT062_07970 [Proteobacteria bacterium]|nr:hypothetical protein [Pseudomonadota bacterium]